MGSFGSEHGRNCFPSHFKHEEHHHNAHEHCPHHHHHHHCEHDHSEEMKSSYFLALADQAWQEVLKDKIKEYILETQGERMAGLAKIVAEGNHKRWGTRMEEKQGCTNFMEELGKYFSQMKNKKG